LRAIIFTGGDITNYDYVKRKISKDDFIVCADSGTKHIYNLSIDPDVIVGDFDSLNNDILNSYKEKKIRIVKHKKEKDETDTELAVNFVTDLGYKEIILFGALGSRFDHSFANVSILKILLDKGIKASIMDSQNEIYIISDEIELQGNVGDTVSLLPLFSEVYGVTTYGLKYGLENATIFFGKPLGISNIFLENKIKVTIKKGFLLVVKSTD
jgi:thiamine pyrophosphokinase